MKRATSTSSPSSKQGKKQQEPCLNECLLDILETENFSDVQFIVGADGQCFNCHKAVIAARSDILAIAMGQRWNTTYNCVNGNGVIRLPTTDPRAFKAFLQYLYSDRIYIPNSDANIDVLLNIMSLSHMYDVRKLLSDSLHKINSNINANTCWKIFKATRRIEGHISERAFKVLINNIHEVASKSNYLQWDGETVYRILSVNKSYVTEINMFHAILKWRDFPGDPLEPPREDTFKTYLLPLIRFPTMNSNEFDKVIESKILPSSVIRTLRRYITNRNPRRRNITTYSNIRRFSNIYNFQVSMYPSNSKSIICQCEDMSDENFKRLITSYNAELSITVNFDTSVLCLSLFNVMKKDQNGMRHRFYLVVTLKICSRGIILYKEDQKKNIGTPSLSRSMFTFTLSRPCTLNARTVYSFHVLYQLVEADQGVIVLDPVERFGRNTFEFSWSSVPQAPEEFEQNVGHGIVMKTSYKGDNTKTPRWIHSIDFRTVVSHDTCNIS